MTKKQVSIVALEKYKIKSYKVFINVWEAVYMQQGDDLMPREK